jgi:hypothetical protein
MSSTPGVGEQGSMGTGAHAAFVTMPAARAGTAQSNGCLHQSDGRRCVPACVPARVPRAAHLLMEATAGVRPLRKQRSMDVAGWARALPRAVQMRLAKATHTRGPTARTHARVCVRMPVHACTRAHVRASARMHTSLDSRVARRARGRYDRRAPAHGHGVDGRGRARPGLTGANAAVPSIWPHSANATSTPPRAARPIMTMGAVRNFKGPL